MRLYLVHHADALLPSVDPQRPLSSVGLQQAEQLASGAAARGVAPAAIWHSGKLRARQTAEAFLRHCNSFAEFKMVRGLRPEDPPDWIRDVLEGEDRDVLVAGHMPQLADLARLLGASGPFPLHGMISMERTGPRRYEESWRELI
ncbi:MAG: histidine phosphatase family protein [Vicinamibacterales bacterium]